MSNPIKDKAAPANLTGVKLQMPYIPHMNRAVKTGHVISAKATGVASCSPDGVLATIIHAHTTKMLVAP